MAYVQGFIASVPTARKDDYASKARDMGALFMEFGATRVLEAWGDDVPEGKITDFRRAVNAEPGETVVVSWLEFPSRAVRDAANDKMMADPRMQAMGEDMPMDGKRMIFGGFDPFIDERGEGRTGYADAFVLPVSAARRQAYRDMAAKASVVFKEFGAVRVVEAWGDDVPAGKVTDFKRAVQATSDEGVVFSYVEWPDKAARDTGWEKMMKDERMQPGPDGLPFDGKRMFWGGFMPLFMA